MNFCSKIKSRDVLQVLETKRLCMTALSHSLHALFVGAAGSNFNTRRIVVTLCHSLTSNTYLYYLVVTRETLSSEQVDTIQLPASLFIEGVRAN